MDLVKFREREAQIYFNLMTAKTPQNKAEHLQAYINHYLTQPGQELYSNTYISRDLIEYLVANFADSLEPDQHSRLALPIIQTYQERFDPNFEPSLVGYFSNLPSDHAVLELVQELTYGIQKKQDRQAILGKAMHLSEFLMSPAGQNYLRTITPQLQSDIHRLYQILINQNYLTELVAYYEPIFHPSQLM